MSLSKTIPVRASQILEICKNPTFERYLRFVQGADSSAAQKAVEPGNAGPDTLCFVSTKEDLQKVINAKASLIIALDKLPLTEAKLTNEQALFASPNISAAMSLVLPFFDKKVSRFHHGVHPAAIVDPTANLGPGVSIGAGAVIGAHVILGEGCIVGPQTVVERGAQVGAHTILHPQVFIGADCIVGNLCEIHPHTTIGADGFGFVQGHDQRRHKIPQIGIVVLEDRVEIGANCTVDRATLGETRIGEGTKLDNLCHVAHNCRIGKNCVFAGGFMIAGSSTIGDNVMIGGNTLVSDHVNVGSNIIIGGRAGVAKDLTEPGAYSGYPIEPMKDSMRTTANLIHLTSMRKQLAKIRKHLGITDEE